MGLADLLLDDLGLEDTVLPPVDYQSGANGLGLSIKTLDNDDMDMDLGDD